MNPRLHIVFALALLFGAGAVQGQGTAFTYQGRLDSSGAPYTGQAEFQATLWSAAVNGSQIAANAAGTLTVGVTNGLFLLPLDFGLAFSGADRWLQLNLRTTLGSFTPLSPRQKIAPTPYAMTAANALNVAQNAVTATSLADNSVNTAEIANSAVTASKLSAGGATAGNFLAYNGSSLVWSNLPSASPGWNLSGNGGIVPGTHFIGTTDSAPLEFRANGDRVLRLEKSHPLSEGVNVIAGFSANSAQNNSVGATISGGGRIGFPNRVTLDWGTVGGGAGNHAGWFSTVSGGSDNFASHNANTIVGGSSNTNSGNRASIGGGFRNVILLGAEYAAIPGGIENRAADRAFAAGSRAKADHSGAFVWADSTAEDFASTAPDQFCIRASGGVQLSTNTSIHFGHQTRQMLNLWGEVYGIGVQNQTFYTRSDGGFAWFRKGNHSDVRNDPGANPGTLLAALDENGNLFIRGSINSPSDRDRKENFKPVSPAAVLEKVVALPLSEWNYKSESGARHLGPVAQDFHAAFGLGSDEKHISTVDADGVALAAIQGLNQKLEEKLRHRDQEVQELKRLVETLVKKLDENSAR